MAIASSKDSKITVLQILLPVTLIGFVLFIMLAFQSSQIMMERKALHDAKSQQAKPLEESKKVSAQLDALALGTKKLSENGNKDAKAIVDRMKQLGINIGAAGQNQGQAGQGGAAAPAGGQPPAPAMAPGNAAPDAAPAGDAPAQQ